MKRAIAAVVGGMITLGAWNGVVNGMLGVQRSIEMRRLADDRELYELLARRVEEPGRYVLNPDVMPGGPFPGDEPVFGIQYSGVGHADAWQEVAAAFAAFLLVSVLAIVLLQGASEGVRSTFGRRLLFLAGIGSVCAAFRFLDEFGIGSFRLVDAGMLAVADLAAWILAGAVMAAILRPEAKAPRVMPAA